MNQTELPFAIFTSAKNAQDTAMTVTASVMTRRMKMIDKYNEVGILEHTAQSRAKPMQKCAYPKCEECDKYRGHYCTVPMVISKQIWQETAEKFHMLEKRLTDLENLVTDEILRSKQHSNRMVNAQGEEVNYTWDDYLRKENE